MDPGWRSGSLIACSRSQPVREPTDEARRKLVFVHELLDALDRVRDAVPRERLLVRVEDHRAGPRIAVTRLPDAARVSDDALAPELERCARIDLDALHPTALLAVD